MADVLAIRQNLGEVLRPQHVAQRRLCEKSSGSVCVLDCDDDDDDDGGGGGRVDRCASSTKMMMMMMMMMVVVVVE